jgi:tetratricopeptide (TPR) repeat protein
MGVCPFCKSILGAEKSFSMQPSVTVGKVYADGNLPLAMALAKKVHLSDAEAQKNVKFLLLYTKILLDSEASSSQIKVVLNEAFLLAPADKDVLDYMDIVELRSQLKKGINDSAEVELRNLVRRSPGNVHGHFILGTHIFWMDEQPLSALLHLETCVRLAPNFLRAWGCLGAIYKKIGNVPFALSAFKRCLEIEKDPYMIDFFKKELEDLE